MIANATITTNSDYILFVINEIYKQPTTNTFDTLFKNSVAIVAIIATVCIALYNNKKNTENLKLQIEQNERSMFTQINQHEIIKTIRELAEIISNSDKNEIKNYVNGVNGIYLPADLNKNILQILDNYEEDILEKHEIKPLMELINKAIFNLSSISK